MSIGFSKPQQAHEEVHRRIVRQDLEQGRAGSNYLDWFTDGVYKLENGIGSANSSASSSSAISYTAPTPITMASTAAASTPSSSSSSSSTSTSSKLFAAMSPRSRQQQLQQQQTVDDEPASITLEQLASIP